jgi:hypothetical protein
MTPDGIALSVVNVRLVLGQWTHGHPLVAQIILTLLWTLCYRASAMDLAELETLLAVAVRESLQRAGIPEKAAAAILGMDYGHFQQALRREGRELSVFKLARLPWIFWGYFLPALSAIVVQHHLSEVLDTAKELIAMPRRNA